MLKWLREFRRSWRGIVKLEQLPDYGMRLTPPDERVVRLKCALRGFVKSPWAVAIIGGLDGGLAGPDQYQGRDHDRDALHGPLLSVLVTTSP